MAAACLVKATAWAFGFNNFLTADFGLRMLKTSILTVLKTSILTEILQGFFVGGVVSIKNW